MTSISSADAFLIFGKWRDNESQIQVSFRKEGKSAGSPAGILEVFPKEESISALIVVDGQPAKWTGDFRRASFSYGEPKDTAAFPEFAEGKWASYLLVELPDGDSILFAERFREE